MPGLVSVYIAHDITHAYLLKSALGGENIPAEVGNDDLQPLLGEVPQGLSTLPHILVAEEHAEAARKFLLELEKKGWKTATDFDELEADADDEKDAGEAG